MTDTVKVNVRLYRSDLDEIRRTFPSAGYNRVVREIVHRAVAQLRERVNAELARRLNDIESEGGPRNARR